MENIQLTVKSLSFADVKEASSQINVNRRFLQFTVTIEDKQLILLADEDGFSVTRNGVTTVKSERKPYQQAAWTNVQRAIEVARTL